MKYYAVIGRMLWADDDNFSIIFHTDSHESACKQFTDLVYEDHGIEVGEREELERSGEGVSIAEVLVSDTEITK